MNFWDVIGKGWKAYGSGLKKSWNVYSKALGDSWNIFKGGLGSFGSYLSGLRDDLNGTNAAKLQYEQNLALQQNQQAFNSAEAEKQRQFEQSLSDTQYQRAANDLRAAGLNPWLAVTGMNGSNPSGAVATSSAANVNQRPSGAETLGSLVSSAASAAIIAKIVSQIVKK